MSSILYAANLGSQTVVNTGETTVNFGNAVVGNKCCGKTIYMSGGNVCVEDLGKFSGDVNITVQATTAGTAIVRVYNNGSEIPGARAFVYITQNAYDNIQIPFVISKNCKSTSTISVVISGVTGTVTNAAIRVAKA